MTKILVIDDKKDNLITVKALLKNLQPEYEVLTVESGTEGIKLAKTTDPDTILLDVHMPRIDGYEVCRRLRADKKTEGIPIIFLTAVKTSFKDRIKGLELGGDAYLTKPVDEGELLATLHSMLRIKKVEDDLVKGKDLLEETVAERTMELQELNAKYLDLYDHAPDMFCSVDAISAKILHCNQTLADALGYQKDEITGQHIFFVYHPDCFKKAEKTFLQFVDIGEIHDAELQLKRKDGSKIDVSLNVSAVRDETGKVLYSRSIWRDITKPKKIEEALRLTQFSVDNSIDAVYWMGSDAKFIYVNNAAVKALGYSKEELLTMTVHEIDPDFPEEVWPAHWADLKEKKSFIIHTIHQRKDKSTFPVEITVNYIQFGDNEINCAIARNITERKQADEELRESEERLRSITENSSDYIMLIDQDLKIKFINRTVPDLKKEDVIGQSVIDFTPEDFKKLARDKYQSVFKTGKQTNYQTEYRAENGETHYFEVRLSPITKEGKIETVVSSSNNITERKSLEKIILSERNEFNSILQDLPVGVAVLDTDDKYVYINPFSIKIDGYKNDPDSLIGKDVRNNHPEYILPIIEELLNDFKSGKNSYFSRETKRGKRSVDISYHAIRNAAGEYQGLTRLVSDITERKRAKEELQRAKDFNEEIVTNSPVGILRLDSELKIIYENPKMKSILGVPEGEESKAIGMRISNVPSFVKTGLTESIDDFVKGNALHKELPFVSLYGKESIISFKGVPIMKDNKFTGALILIEDITDRKKTEEECKEALAEVQNANEVKNLFLANMSHELRTPLNTILGFTDLIEESTRDVVGEEEKKFFNVITSSGERLMHTVHEILDISQIEAGTYVQAIEDFNLVHKVQGIVDGFQLNTKEKQLILEFCSTRKNISVRGDQHGIFQSICNIVDNAIKYTEKGKITVDLRQKSKCAILTIQDTGIGMSQEYLDRIFEAFSQESEGYSKKYQGIGLGMAIVKGHLDLNQVDIAVDSFKGKGTTFTLTFPDPKQISDQQTETKKSKRNGSS